MLCIDGVRQYRSGASLVGSNHDGQQFSGYRMESLTVKSPDWFKVIQLCRRVARCH